MSGLMGSAAVSQMLYGFLVKHFVKLAGLSPPALEHLDALTPVRIVTCSDVSVMGCKAQLVC